MVNLSTESIKTDLISTAATDAQVSVLDAYAESLQGFGVNYVMMSTNPFLEASFANPKDVTSSRLDVAPSRLIVKRLMVPQDVKLEHAHSPVFNLTGDALMEVKIEDTWRLYDVSRNQLLPPAWKEREDLRSIVEGFEGSNHSILNVKLHGRGQLYDFVADRIIAPGKLPKTDTTMTWGSGVASLIAVVEKDGASYFYDVKRDVIQPAPTSVEYELLKGHSGTVVATVKVDRDYKFYDVSTGTFLSIGAHHIYKESGVAALPDGREMVIARVGGHLGIYDVTNHKFFKPGRKSFDELRIPASSVNGELISVCAVGGSYYYYDAAKNRLLKPEGENLENAWKPAFGPEGQIIGVVQIDERYQFYDLAKNKLIAPRWEEISGVDDYSVMYCPDGRALARVRVDSKPRFYDLASDRLYTPDNVKDFFVRQTHSLPDGRIILFMKLDDSKDVNALYDLTNDRIVWDGRARGKYFSDFHSQKCSDGNVIVKVSEDGVEKLFDLLTETFIPVPDKSSLSFEHLVVSPNGHMIGAIKRFLSNTWKFWDVTNNAIIIPPDNIKFGDVGEIRFIREGCALATVKVGDEWKMFDVFNRQILELECQSITEIGKFVQGPKGEVFLPVKTEGGWSLLTINFSPHEESQEIDSRDISV